MQSEKANQFILVNARFFDPNDIPTIQTALEDLSEEKYFAVQILNYKDPTMMLILSILVGFIGIDRFMLEQTTLGVLKLITFGGCGIWTLIDWFLIMDETKKYNKTKFLQTVQ